MPRERILNFLNRSAANPRRSDRAPARLYSLSWRVTKLLVSFLSKPPRIEITRATSIPRRENARKISSGGSRTRTFGIRSTRRFKSKSNVKVKIYAQCKRTVEIEAAWKLRIWGFRQRKICKLELLRNVKISDSVHNQGIDRAIKISSIL